MMLQAQKCPNRPADMVPWSPRLSRRTARDTTILLQSTVIRLACPDLGRHPRSLVHRHAQVACRPVLRGSVYSVKPKRQNKAIALEMHTRARFAYRTVRECP